ncbi:hypothetical protein GKE82_21380 [Conexibacter sp. W3-3-2]|uniref:hypothetical protein n=1 Tax=Conexibacter sp. W3-3-2 TaxID=2675227 RepID=UPI001328C4FB|nr:hypothetical protein [Conexibacter sp. W3-3-2]MTD46771.1 hypothetical protein [Conexibacter sp. W3-3-2]
MLYAVIIACEIGFWVVLAAGLLARYALRRRRLSTALLVAAPLVDVVLLAATVADLRGGATANASHGLAAAYIGFSIAFGHRLVRRADAHAAHRLADGPKPPKPPRGGPARAAYEWRLWLHAVLAGAITCALIAGAIALVGDAARTEELESWFPRVGTVVGVWGVIALSYVLFPGADRDRPPSRTSPG